MVGNGLNTQDILRCSAVSKSLHYLLTNPALDKVWRAARSIVVPIVPAPRIGVSEYRWASFLFGNRKCCICGELTNSLPTSYTNMLIHCTQVCIH